MGSASGFGKARLDIVEDIIGLITSKRIRINALSQENELTSEKDLAEKLGFGGRTPVLREALALLTRDGIVVPRPQRGYEVRYIPSEEAKEILALRAETQKLVVERLATQDLGNRLDWAKEILGSLAQLTRDSAAFLRLERRLWSELARLGGFLNATQVIATWSDQLRVFYTTESLGQGEMDTIVEVLRTLIERVEQHDASESVKAVETYLQAMLQRLRC